MSQAITMDRAGRIVLPADLRRQLNLQPGARLLLTVVAQHIELTPEPQQAAELVTSPAKRPVLRATGQPFDAAAAVRAERDAQRVKGSGLKF